MANVKVSSMSFPYPLGKVFPGASYATVSVPLTQNKTPVREDGTTPEVMASEILIYAWGGGGGVAANTGAIYVCNNASAPDFVTFTNIVAVLQPGDTFPRESNPIPATKDITKLYIGAENAADFAIPVVTF